MATTVKRSSFVTFLDKNPSGAANYVEIGDGVTTATINYNPQVLEETYINQDSGTTEVQSYRPNLPIEATAKKGDNAFDFIDGLRKSRAVLDAAKTSIVNVWKYETPTGDSYPAEKQSVSIQVDSFGGDGGAATKINYTINFIGAPIAGNFDVVLKTFTPS